MIGPGIFRLVLASFVVLSHVSSLDVGRPAVIIFFMLSGYWVMRMYDTKYSHMNQPAIQFYASRIVRLWPTFIFCILLVMISNWLLISRYSSEEWISLLLLGTGTHRIDPLTVSWSLDIEFQFYLFVPVICASMFLYRGDNTIWLIRTSSLFLSLALFLASWICFREYGVLTCLMFLPAFALGVILSQLNYRWAAKSAYWSLAIFILFAFFIFRTSDYRGLLLKTVPFPYNEDITTMIWVGLLLPFIAFNVQTIGNARDRVYGDLSYPLYLIHVSSPLRLGQ